MTVNTYIVNGEPFTVRWYHEQDMGAWSLTPTHIERQLTVLRKLGWAPDHKTNVEALLNMSLTFLAADQQREAKETYMIACGLLGNRGRQKLPRHLLVQ